MCAKQKNLLFNFTNIWNTQFQVKIRARDICQKKVQFLCTQQSWAQMKLTLGAIILCKNNLVFIETKENL